MPKKELTKVSLNILGLFRRKIHQKQKKEKEKEKKERKKKKQTKNMQQMSRLDKDQKRWQTRNQKRLCAGCGGEWFHIQVDELALLSLCTCAADCAPVPRGRSER